MKAKLFISQALARINKLLSPRVAKVSKEMPSSFWYPLFAHMSQDHGLTLLDDECASIADAADECRLKASGGVRWALVNSLRHLNNQELHDLGAAIASRSGGVYCNSPAEAACYAEALKKVVA